MIVTKLNYRNRCIIFPHNIIVVYTNFKPLRFFGRSIVKVPFSKPVVEKWNRKELGPAKKKEVDNWVESGFVKDRSRKAKQA